MHKALDGKRKKLASTINEEWEDLDRRALNTIWLCLVDDVLFNIVGEETIIAFWSKMGSLYDEILDALNLLEEATI